METSVTLAVHATELSFANLHLSVWRVLKAAGRLDRHNQSPSKKGAGFVQPDGPHLHWHIDVSYINVGGSFFCLRLQRRQRLCQAESSSPHEVQSCVPYLAPRCPSHLATFPLPRCDTRECVSSPWLRDHRQPTESIPKPSPFHCRPHSVPPHRAVG